MLLGKKHFGSVAAGRPLLSNVMNSAYLLACLHLEAILATLVSKVQDCSRFATVHSASGPEISDARVSNNLVEPRALRCWSLPPFLERVISGGWRTCGL